LNFHKIYCVGTCGKKIQATPDVKVKNCGYGGERGDYTVVITGDRLAYRYEIMDMLGKGALQRRDPLLESQ
jgi:dual specificity tyrosine-phosphorylation-regulated kinase 2/3/4